MESSSKKAKHVRELLYIYHKLHSKVTSFLDCLCGTVGFLGCVLGTAGPWKGVLSPLRMADLQEMTGSPCHAASDLWDRAVSQYGVSHAVA